MVWRFQNWKSWHLDLMCVWTVVCERLALVNSFSFQWKFSMSRRFLEAWSQVEESLHWLSRTHAVTQHTSGFLEGVWVQLEAWKRIGHEQHSMSLEGGRISPQLARLEHVVALRSPLALLGLEAWALKLEAWSLKIASTRPWAPSNRSICSNKIQLKNKR